MWYLLATVLYIVFYLNHSTSRTYSKSVPKQLKAPYTYGLTYKSTISSDKLHKKTSGSGFILL